MRLRSMILPLVLMIFAVIAICGPLIAAGIEETEALELPDSSFEGGAKSWNIPAGSEFASISSQQAASGKASLKIEDSSGNRGSSVRSADISPLTEGLYELRGKVYPVSGSGLRIYAQLYDDSGNRIGGNGHLLGLGGNEKQWKSYSKTFVVPRRAAKLNVWIHSYNASKVTAYLDDFEIVVLKARDEGMDRDLQTIKDRLIERELPSGASKKAILNLADSLESDGHWPDIDYTDKSRARWQPSKHVGRILKLARACRTKDHELYENDRVREALLRAYNYWMEQDLKCPNWWYNRIGVPRQLYRAMLLIEDELTEEQKEAGIEILKRSELGMTGQNLVWVAEVTIARGCLQGDPWVVMEAFRQIANEIEISANEGIQADYSFYQHGRQLYSGGYGKGFSVDCAGFAELARGTEFAFPDEKIRILSGYILDGQQWMIRGRTFDYSACGREISRKGAGHTGSLRRACRSMLAIEPPREGECEAFLERLKAGADVPPQKQLTGNRNFWRSEFMTHHRPEFYTSVRMTSPQVVQSETCNRENLRGQFLSDGVTYIMRDGEEYRGIFPVWDWRRLPGTTEELTGESPGISRARGKRNFVGGVSDGLYGVAAMDFVRESLSAKKSWFFFDGEIVCLGAGIKSSGDHQVWTSVNQCNADGKVFVADEAGQRELQAGSAVLNSPSRAHHDGVTYVFRNGGPVKVSNEMQTGNWWRINHVYSKDEVKQRVFSAGIDHGVSPDGDSYMYVIAPSVPKADAAQYAEDLPITVLANNPSVQAVGNTRVGVCGIAFYEPGEVTIPDGTAISVDKPCLVLVRKIDNGVTLTASNPANEPLELTLSISRRLKGESCTWNADQECTGVHLSLPDGMHTGESVRRQLQRP